MTGTTKPVRTEITLDASMQDALKQFIATVYHMREAEKKLREEVVKKSPTKAQLKQLFHYEQEVDSYLAVLVPLQVREEFKQQGHA